MCGIAGIFAYHSDARNVKHEELVAVRDAMANRGPDGAGAWLAESRRVGLAHRRLAIIGIGESGAQPMSAPDQRLHVTFNGEIYNYRELRRGLQARGYCFFSETDTEVLLYLYAEYGADMVRQLRGMYAFAIYDEPRQTLFLARDAFGIKPLYYADDGKTLRFASQVKALLKGQDIDTSPCAAGHVGFYLWGHVPEPYTLFKGIRALPAGTTMTITRAGSSPLSLFFSIPDEFSRASESQRFLPEREIEERFHAALRDTVRAHHVADVPVGIFLSAGLDSTTLTALSAELGCGDLHTLTLAFDEYRGTDDDEASLAQLVANHYGTKHRTKWISKTDFEERIEDVLEAMDQPSIDGVNAYFVSQAAAECGMKVALSGLGGDELFGGYPSFSQIPRMVKLFGRSTSLPGVGKALRWMSAPALKRLSSPKYAGLLEYGGNYGGAYLLRRGLYMPWELSEVLDGDLVREGWTELRPLVRLEEVEKRIGPAFHKVSAMELSFYMRNQLLRDSDWAGMAHSVEIRVPLVDIELFRTAVLLGGDKGLSKERMARAPAKPLPPAILKRRKTGFQVPVHDWTSSKIHRAPRGMREWARMVNPPVARKRVLALVSDAFGSTGGIAKFNRDLLSALCSHPELKEVIAIPRLMPAAAIGPLPRRLVYLTDAVNSKLKYTGKVLSLVTRTKADAVICGHIHLLPVSWIASTLMRAPLLLVVHGIDAWQPTGRWVTDFLAKKVDGFISVSALTRHKVLTWTGLDPATGYLLPNAVDLEQFTPAPKNIRLLRLHALENRIVIMTMGRLEAAERLKGIDEVLDLLPELIIEIPKLTYLVVGDGNDRERLQKKAQELGMGAHVVFTGFVQEEEKRDYYALSDAFVMPSRGEGFGIVFLEAMACGVPVVGSLVDGSREALRDGALGTLVDPGSAADIKRGILEALARPKGVPAGLEYFCQKNFERRLHRIMDNFVAARGTQPLQLERKECV